jgi:hypothetical protein
VGRSVIGLAPIACPTTHQCTTLGSGVPVGAVDTFDPSSPAGLVSAQGPGDPIAVACPSSALCVAVAYSGAPAGAGTINTYIFNPAVSSSVKGFGPFSHDLRDVSCPSTMQCTVVGASGAITFDPSTVTPGPGAPAYPPPAAIDSGAAMNAIDCWSTTSCVAVVGTAAR